METALVHFSMSVFSNSFSRFLPCLVGKRVLCFDRIDPRCKFIRTPLQKLNVKFFVV